MEKVSDKEKKSDKEKLPDKYKQPTEEELHKAIFSPGRWIAKCRICGEIIRSFSLEELKQHQCINGKIRIQTTK